MEQQIIGATTRLLTQTDFPLQSYEPKVQVPFQVLPGQCPRKIEIERYAGELEREAWPKEVASARLEGRGAAHHQVASPAAEPVELFKQLSFNRNTWLPCCGIGRAAIKSLMWAIARAIQKWHLGSWVFTDIPEATS